MENFNAPFIAFLIIVILSLIWILATAKPKRRKSNRVYKEGDVIEISERIIRYNGLSGRTVGRFVAQRTVSNLKGGDRVYIGLSLCDADDKYRKLDAQAIALEKALKCYTEPLKIPANLSKEYLAFYRRCGIYFKGCELPKIVQVYNYDSKTYEPTEVVFDGYYLTPLLPVVPLLPLVEIETNLTLADSESKD